MFKHIKIVIQYSGNKAFPWAVTTCAGICLGYFKNRNDARTYCATDGQAFA